MSSASSSGARPRTTACTRGMARVSPAAPEQFAQVADVMARWQKTKGYPPNSWLTMARRPDVLRAYRALHTAVMMDEGEVPKALKFMVAHLVSRAAGDPYSAAHNAENAAHIAGVPIERVEALSRFATSPLFTPAERAALALAEAARCLRRALHGAAQALQRERHHRDRVGDCPARLAQPLERDARHSPRGRGCGIRAPAPRALGLDARRAR